MFLQNTHLYKSEDNITAMKDGCKTDKSAVNTNSISLWVLNVESPFKWQPRRFEDVSVYDVIEAAKEKAEYDDLALDKFARLITLVYEYTHQTKYEEAMKMITAANSLIEQEQLYYMDGKKHEEFKLGMNHVLMATQAFVLASQGFEAVARKAYEELVPISSMAEKDLSSIYAIKAKFFSLYRKIGFQQAVESSRKALELNPEEPMWMFLLAESLRRMEKYFPSFEIPMEELTLLENAVERDRDARYLVHLALRYNNCASNVFNKHRNEPEFYNSDLFKTIKDMQHKATDLYKEALMLEPDDEIVNRRCGFGLMKASTKIARENKQLIKFALDKALLLSPTSSMTLHYLGKYYKKLEGNEAKALDCFQRATQSTANLPAHCDLIKLKFELYGLDEYNPMQDLEIMLKQQEEIDPHNKLQALCHIGSYYLLVRRNLDKALEYLIPVLEQEPTIIKYHRSLLLDIEIIDLSEILANEIKRTEEDKLPNKYRLMKIIANVSTDYLVKPVKENLIDELMDKHGKRKINKHRKNLIKNEKSQTELNWRLRKESSGTNNPSSSNNSKSSQPWRSYSSVNTARSASFPRKYSKYTDNDCNWREEKEVENWRTEKNVITSAKPDKPEPLSWRRQSVE